MVTTKSTDRMPLMEKEEITFPPFEMAHLFGPNEKYGDWRDELASEGFYVVKGAVSREKGLEYRDRALTWQENFGLGFKRGDVSTYKNECLPVHVKGGMVNGYAVGHEDWVWDLRCERGIIEAFAKIWGTDELVTSFDGATIMLPHRTDVPDAGKWEHTDQSPSRRGFYCVQGIANLNDCGPEDGGLMVLRGSSRLFEEFFDVHGRTGFKTWGPVDWCNFSIEHQQWFFERGCVWEKVCAGPGDLILWDSRTVHYNCTPKGDRDRVCTYICMAPARLMTEKDKADRKHAFANYLGSTHVPFDCHFRHKHEAKVRADTGKPCPLDTGIPQRPRKSSPTVLKLAGVEPY
ncbi:hypothetical protein MNV49_001789 [Pseudohyphozyma bogoriensis]|nr:hypothetical protein MNV49_001789 [Pseudohyphozyma bogoriensis]